MKIKIEVNSFEELISTVERLKNGTILEHTKVGVELEPSQEVQPGSAENPQQTGNMSRPAYGRQIAPHFPNANVSQMGVETYPNTQTVPPQQPSPITRQVQPQQTMLPAQSAPPQPSAPTAQQAAPPAVSTTMHEYTQDDLARAAMQLMDKGGMQQLQQLLAGYGCETLQQLPKEQYGNFATALRGMGAQI